MISYTEQNLHRYRKQTVSAFITALDCGTTYAPEGFVYKQRFLEVYELLYVIKGSLSLVCGGTPVSLTAHQAVILPPFQRVKGLSPCEVSTVFYYVEFMSDRQEIFHIRTVCTTLEQPARFEDTLERLSFSFKRTAVREFTRDAYLLALLDELDSADAAGDHIGPLAHKVAAYVEQNLGTPLTVQQISDALCYHRDYLCRTVRQFYGVPLKTYVVLQKISTAKRLLATSNYTVAEIAGYVGFSDPNRFTKFFKYHVNLSPSQYRRQIQ